MRALLALVAALLLGACAGTGRAPTPRVARDTPRRAPTPPTTPAQPVPVTPPAVGSDPRVAVHAGRALRLLRVEPRQATGGPVVLDIAAETVELGPDERLVPAEVLERLVTTDGTEPPFTWDDWVDPESSRVGASRVVVHHAQRGLKELVLRAVVARVLGRKTVVADLHALPAEIELGPFDAWVRASEGGVHVALHARGDADAWFRTHGQPRLPGLGAAALLPAVRVTDARGTTLHTESPRPEPGHEALRFLHPDGTPTALPLTLRLDVPVRYRLTHHRFVFRPMPLPIRER